MPAAGARRSTRVFMPKAPKPPTQDQADPATRVLRSGKRLAADRIRWDAKDDAPAFHVDDDHGHDEDDGQQDDKDPPKPELPPFTKSFGIVYSRKRRRRPPTEVLVEGESSSRFGIVYSRRKKRSKVTSVRREPEPEPDTPSDLASAIPCSSSWEFASRTGFLDARFSALVDGAVTHADPVTLVVLVDASCSRSSHRLLGLLLPVLRWMRRSRQRGKVWNLASLVSSVGIAPAFASQGLHFVKLQHQRYSVLLHRTLVHCGWCVLYGAKKSGPLLSVNFSALPSYFQSLHTLVALDSMYLPAAIRQSRLLVAVYEEIYPRTPFDVNSGSQTEPTAHLGSDQPHRVVQDYVPLEQVAGIVVHGLRLKKYQRKRSSMRNPRNRRRPMARLPDNAIGMKQKRAATQTEVKLPSTKQAPPVELVQPKAALEISLDLLENMDESDVSTPMGSTRKKRSLKSPVERMNEKLSLVEVRQTIDSVHCKANLLILQVDRCWREDGAEVMLELSDTKEWCIVVKIQGVTRCTLKPSDPRLNGINRYTHACMWAVDDAWKLEFTDKWDWLLFKELHVVGRERNSQGKTIPIPGVYEVSVGMEGGITDPFARPVPDYIRVVDDEVGRALSRDSIYDMDSEDEQWLIQLNHADSDQNSSQWKHVSYEDFEKIISTFEKDAYNNPEGTKDVGELLSRYPALGKDDNVLAVHEYWTNKRSKRAAPLLRIFQGVPLRRGQLSQKSAMKRKRSFKRQRSRGKPESFLQDNAEEEVALQRVVQAERAAKQAVEIAVHLRSRAQSLMANADLATYKSVMALRIAEAARISNTSRDIVSTILD